MDEPRTYQTPPLEPATNVVPLGVHLASNEAVVFDPPDEALLEDLRAMIAAFVRTSPTGDSIAERRLRRSLPMLTTQRDALTVILQEMLDQMTDENTGRAYELSHMLASTFDRFGQFADFRVLAAGCGDAAVDPFHQDAELAAEIREGYGRGAGGPG